MQQGFTIRHDLKRAVLGDFALALGLVPGDTVVGESPRPGYTVDYTPGRDDEPDTYLFHICVSHENLAALLGRAFALLPDQVTAIVEIGSRDAYRQVDVYLSADSMPREDFLLVWKDYEGFLLEDGSIAAGANADDPFIEVFLDQFKRLAVHVPVSMREDVETMLTELGLGELPRLWSPGPDTSPDGADTDSAALVAGDQPDIPLAVRPVLLIDSPYAPDVDELLLELRERLMLELNIDPTVNVDDAGRELGLTLWHVVLILSATTDGEEEEDDDDRDAQDVADGAYAFVWVTAESMMQVQNLIEEALSAQDAWRFEAIYTIDRVPFDERPDALNHLPPRPNTAAVHLLNIEPWGDADEAVDG